MLMNQTASNRKQKSSSCTLEHFVTNKVLDMGSEVRSISCSQDGRIAIAFSNVIQLFDIKMGSQIMSDFIGHDHEISSIQYSLDDRLILSGSYDKSVRLWDAYTGQQIGDSFLGHEHYVVAVVFLKNGQLIASAGLDQAIRIWNIHTRIVQYNIQREGINLIDCSKDGNLFVEVNHQSFKIMDISKEEIPKLKITFHTQSILCLKMSTKTDIIASGSYSNPIKLWNRRTGKLINRFDEFSKGSTSIQFSEDSKLLLCGYHNSEIRLWNIAQRTNKILRGHTDIVTSVQFTHDGRHVISGSFDFNFMVQEMSQLN